jgi:hypothetical protein
MDFVTGKARQGNDGSITDFVTGKARQGKGRQDKTMEGKTRDDKAGQ